MNCCIQVPAGRALTCSTKLANGVVVLITDGFQGSLGQCRLAIAMPAMVMLSGSSLKG